MYPLSYRHPPRGSLFRETLLNIEFHELPYKARKTITYVNEMGSAGSQVPWEPRCIIEGQTVPNVQFEAWRSTWPNDGSDLAGKSRNYLPKDQQSYPSYFPYWSQVKTSIHKAVIRVIDSGLDLENTPHI